MSTLVLRICSISLVALLQDGKMISSITEQVSISVGHLADLAFVICFCSHVRFSRSSINVEFSQPRSPQTLGTRLEFSKFSGHVKPNMKTCLHSRYFAENIQAIPFFFLGIVKRAKHSASPPDHERQFSRALARFAHFYISQIHAVYVQLAVEQITSST